MAVQAIQRKAVISHDGASGLKNEIDMYDHCSKCLREIPYGVAPREYARLNVGITKRGHIQVWCVRHDRNVDLMRMADGAERDGDQLCVVCGFQTDASRVMSEHRKDTGHRNSRGH